MEKLKKGELKIYYNGEKGINTELDIALEKTLKEFGYKRWASGLDYTGRYGFIDEPADYIRDLAFDKGGTNG